MKQFHLWTVQMAYTTASTTSQSIIVNNEKWFADTDWFQRSQFRAQEATP